MVPAAVKDLLLQSLTHEKGGIDVYEAALECVQNDDLREEWTEYLEHTNRHVEILTAVCEALGIDPNERTPGCDVAEHLGASLVVAMKQAVAVGDPAGAELVACDCVVLAETKDHANWALIGACAKGLKGEAAAALKAAHDEVEDDEDEHLYHSKGWCRELWIQFLGFEPVLPPPEETKHVKTAIGAVHAEQQRPPVLPQE